MIEGTIYQINVEKGKFSVLTKKGKFTFCKSSDIKLLQAGDSIFFDNKFDSTYFYHTRSGDRFAASVEEMDVPSSHFESFCKY